MGNVARRMSTGMQGTPAVHLPEEIITNILLRLPAKSVLRSGAVCKAWHRITTDPRFLADHARLRPAEVVLYTYLDVTPFRSRRPAIEVALDTLPVSSDEAGRRRLIRYPKTYSYLMLASCNGVLLFKKGELSHLLCNPVTRRWAEFRRPAQERHTIYVREYAFYFHQPSGEYRLLCCRSSDTSDKWYILSTGAAEPRQITAFNVEAAGITELLLTTPWALHGHLHWPPRRASAGTGDTSEMVVFDTVSETFRRMAGPPTSTPRLVKLFDMEGLLVAADLGKMARIDLWFLTDYDAGRWELQHQVAAPWQSGPNSDMPVLNHPSCLLSVASMSDDEGNVILGNHYCLVVYNVRRKTVRTVSSVATRTNNVLMSRHVFRESLVQHPSFSARSAADLGLIHFWR
ncbi:hypothetical protein ACP70R_005183 [Stipagrostis hirtigluma subsp. patula]